MRYVILVFLLVLSLLECRAIAKDTIPAELLGNWINTSSQEWEYGFFEDFAIYQSDFWEYKIIRPDRKQIHIALTKAGQEVELTIWQKKGRPMTIACNGGKEQPYERQRLGFQPYFQTDTLLFTEPRVVKDSVTILGYYRNLEKLKPENRSNWGKRNFEVCFNDLLGLEEIRLNSKIDSLGRFRIRIPVYGPQAILPDWGKLWKYMVVVPGETMMLYVDMEEMQPRDGEFSDREVYWGREKDILFMGPYARLHREMVYAPDFFRIRGMRELEENTHSHLEYLHLAELDYRTGIKKINDFRQKYPTVSARCIQVLMADVTYRFANVLMQNRFNARGKTSFGFDNPAYMEYVKQHFTVDSVLPYFLSTRYQGFVRDYTGYHNDLLYRYVEGIGMCKVNGNYWDAAMRELVRAGTLPDVKISEIEKYVSLRDSLMKGIDVFKDLPASEIRQDSCLFAKMEEVGKLTEVADLEQVLMKRDELLLYDTLIPCQALRDICIGRSFANDVLHDRVALSPGLQKLLEEKVTTPAVREQVMEINEPYRKLLLKEIRYPQSLKNTDHLRNIMNPDSLWNAMLAPYRGKVILLDFWGTWCEPCKKMMEFIPPIEHYFKDKDVIFMYFAYSSPEESWKNVIKEFDLSGEKIVHYNLSAEQQRMILDLRGVHAFPTFMLIDREGKIVNAKAPPTQQEKKLKNAIEELLAN